MNYGRDCKTEEGKSIKIFYDKEEQYLNITSSGFCNATQSLRKEKKSEDNKNSENDQKGRNRHNQKGNKNKKMRAILAVEVTTNVTQINCQQTKPLKMTKKNGLH